MMRWTQESYDEYILSLKPSAPNPATLDGKDIADVGPESVLSNKIVKYCKDHGFPCLCLRKSKKAKGFIVKGWTD